MKVKEYYFKDRQETLKDEKDLMLLKQIKEGDFLPYSKYILYDMKYNVAYATIIIPDPDKSSLSKDIFLKYESGVERFLSKFFDVFLGKADDIPVGYTEEQKKDLFYEEDKFRHPFISLEDGKLFCIANFPTREMGKKFCKNFINFFEGKPIEYPWKEFKGQHQNYSFLEKDYSKVA